MCIPTSMSAEYKTADSDSDSEEEEDVPTYKSMLELQLAEVELLRSMYSNPGEFVLERGVPHEGEPAPGAPGGPHEEEAVGALAMIEMFVNGDLDYESLEDRISYTLKIRIGQAELELVVTYPHVYPACPPPVTLRTPLTRPNHRRLTEDMDNFLWSQTRCELYMCNLVDWLNQNYPQYTAHHLPESSKPADGKLAKTEPLARYWIYSHHIYSKFKRKDILDWAKELNLTGFSLPGKPGVVCAEGTQSQVEDYWARLRRLNWKKLALKHIETLNKKTVSNKFRKFGKFEEISFDVRGGKGREYHMDLGKFRQFLEEKGCKDIFEIYFGVEGRVQNS